MLFAETTDETIMESNGFVHDCRIPAYPKPGIQMLSKKPASQLV